jgi:hypothetical protein
MRTFIVQAAAEFVTAVGGFIDPWIERCHVFIWTKTAEDILAHTPSTNCRPAD